MSELDDFLVVHDKNGGVWWGLDPGDQLNLFDALRESRDAALKRAEKAEAYVRDAHAYCARPEGVCLPIEPLP